MSFYVSHITIIKRICFKNMAYIEKENRVYYQENIIITKVNDC